MNNEMKDAACVCPVCRKFFVRDLSNSLSAIPEVQPDRTLRFLANCGDHSPAEYVKSIWGNSEPVSQMVNS